MVYLTACSISKYQQNVYIRREIYQCRPTRRKCYLNLFDMSCVKSLKCLLKAFCTTIKQIAEYVNVQFRAKQTAIFYN